MEQLVAGYLCDVAHIATFEELNHILDQNWVGKSALWPAQVAKSLKAHDGRWKIAANGAVGPQVAAALGDIGHDDPSSLPVESDLYEMILAWHANHPDTKIPAPTLEVVKGWRLALGLPATPPTTTAPTKPVPAKKAAAPASGVPAKKTAAPARKSPARKSPAARVGAPPGKGRGVPRSGY
jgi:hypothetical protein